MGAMVSDNHTILGKHAVRWATFLVCFSSLLLPVACATSDQENVGQVRLAVDFDAGDVQGTFYWDGVQLTEIEAYSLYLFEQDSVSHFPYPYDGTYYLQDVPAGEHTVGLYGSGCNSVDTKLGETSVTVTAGETSTANFELTESAGRVTAVVTLNDKVPAEVLNLEFRSDSGGCPQVGQVNSAGALSRVLTPGSYTLRIRNGAGVVGSLSFDVAKGETTDLGTVNIPVGDVSGTISWAGEQINESEAYNLFLFERDFIGDFPWPADGNYVLTDVSAGDHTVGVYGNSCTSTADSKLGEASVVVMADTTTIADVDLTESAGRVKGSISVNGEPVSDPELWYRSADVSGCVHFSVGSASGVFSRLLSPGNYVVEIHDASSILAQLSFAVTAGKTTDLGSIDVSVGDVSGTFFWGGTQISESDAYNLYLFEPDGISDFPWPYDGTYSLENVPAGSHTLGVHGTGCADAPLGETSFTVSAGLLTTADFDLTPTTGRVTGTITVNGAPLEGGALQFRPASGSGCWQYTQPDPNGVFSRLLLPGTYTTVVYNNAGVLGSFNFPVLAGDMTDVDFGTTPVGTNVKVEVESDEVAGVIELTLTFSKVKTSGQTTIVKSNSGPPIPGGYRLVDVGGSLYWDIDTSAEYDPPITVCIHYDDAAVQGNEEDLELWHDSGSGLINITESLDTDANVICGTVDSLSPFALVEPLNTAPVLSLPGLLVAEAESRDGARVEFEVGASDAEDGSLMPSCDAVSGSTFPLGLTTVGCEVTDSGGATVTGSFDILVEDSKGPIFGNAPDEVTAFATSVEGARVGYPLPTAIDLVDGERPVTCSKEPGAQFPINETLVTCTASDQAGNENQVSFTVWVTFDAATDASFFEVPIRGDGSAFRAGRTLPVSFRLRGVSAEILDLLAEFSATRISGEGAPVVVHEGSFSLRDEQQYGYNFRTKGLDSGIYLLMADLGDGVEHQVTVVLE